MPPEPARTALRLVLPVLAAGALAGVASALLLHLLGAATTLREAHPWLVALLPVAGWAIGWTYHRLGQGSEAGTALILDEIQTPRAVLPPRMSPLILVSTVLTHLVGGSAGREGTAVQMGASLADLLTGPFRLGPDSRRLLLLAGVSAGFASVFGTPLAGAVFGLEVCALSSRTRAAAAVPCLVAALVGDQLTRALGVHHESYSNGAIPSATVMGLFAAAAAGIAFGLAGRAFVGATHAIASAFRRRVPYPPLRPALGGAALGLAIWSLGSTRHLGLGIPVITESFGAAVPPWDFAAKLVFTAWTIGCGFKGGEVTPLFFVGATLGNALSRALPLPMPLLSGLGLVGVFAGASGTPAACSLLALELFGAPILPYAALACLASSLVSGKTGIYGTRRTRARA